MIEDFNSIKKIQNSIEDFYEKDKYFSKDHAFLNNTSNLNLADIKDNYVIFYIGILGNRELKIIYLKDGKTTWHRLFTVLIKK